jgi:mannose-6-phosphate isomerase-like protein (cupin superfamily)
MRSVSIGLALATLVLAGAAAAQTPSGPAATVRKVLAAAKLPTVTDTPLYFRAVSVTLAPGEKASIQGTNGVLFQVSGASEVTQSGAGRTLKTGDGGFVSRDIPADLKTAGSTPSTFLYFALSTAADLTKPSVAGGTARELFRTPSPIPFLKAGTYDANLTQVTFPAGMPSNAPHHRSGAALYFIVSGTGANTVAGKTEAKGPGALVYEPFDLVHQWGNPNREPLTFITFNINPEGIAAVLPGNP